MPPKAGYTGPPLTTGPALTTQDLLLAVHTASLASAGQAWLRSHGIASSGWIQVLLFCLQLKNCGLSDITVKTLEERGITALFPIQKHVFLPANEGQPLVSW